MRSHGMIAGCVILLIQTGYAEQLSFQEGDGGKFSSTTAATIFEQKGGRTKHGKDPVVALEAEYGAKEHKLRQGLLGFPKMIGTKAGQIPPGSKIHSAQLTLVFVNQGSPQTPVTIYPMLKPWKESEVCWKERSVGEAFGDASSFVLDNAAALRANKNGPISPGGGKPGVDYSKKALDAKPSKIGPVTFNVTPAVQAWAGGHPNNGFYLQYLHDDSAQFHSDDAADKKTRPLLRVSFSADGKGAAPLTANILLVDPSHDFRLGPLTPGQTPSVEFAGNEFSLDWQKIEDEWALALRSTRTGRTYGPFPIRHQSPVNLGGVRLRVSAE